jgi:tetratricopeptide (TPR) repeat protein
MRRRLLLTLTSTLSALLVLCAAQAPALGQAVDLIFLAKGAPNRGTIVEMGQNQVTLEVNGVNKPFAVNEIVKITFANEPAELTNARTAALQRNYALAAQELRKLTGPLPERDLIKHDIEFFKALSQAQTALREGGDRAAAIMAMRNFGRIAPQSFHFYEAADVLGDLAMSMGNYADAARYYSLASKAPWPDYQMRSNNAVGRALSADRQFEQALTKFEAVLSANLPTPEAARQKNMALAGKAVCLAETGKAEVGIASLEEVINKADTQDAALLSRTYNALGRCYLKANKPKEAVLAFLHTDLLYSAEAEAHAEALYFLSKHWTDANKSAVARTTLRERYAGSAWATQQ